MALKEPKRPRVPNYRAQATQGGATDLLARPGFNLVYDLGSTSRIAAMRYEPAAGMMDARQGCLITIESAGTEGATLAMRLKGCNAAVSTILHGEHLRIFQSQDAQVEYERYCLIVKAGDKPVCLYCAEIEFL